jgi:hypothetical protein
MHKDETSYVREEISLIKKRCKFCPMTFRDSFNREIYE